MSCFDIFHASLLLLTLQIVTPFPLSFCSFVFLFLENYGVRKLEAVFAVLIATMAISFAWMFGETKPNGKELLIGRFLLPIDLSYHLLV